MPQPAIRDYSLTGPDGAAAVENGRAGAQWYATPIARARMKQLMQRRDAPAIRDTLIWFAALGLSGGLGIALWGSWRAVLPLAVYGVLYGSAADSRWHETSHGTAFRTRWMNLALYQISCFMMLREPTVWRWSHTRHHTDTLIVGRDPEISSPRPPDFLQLLLKLFAIPGGIKSLRHILLHSLHRLSPEEATFIPPMEHHKVYTLARIWLVILGAIAALCIALHSILPAMLIGLPTFYGAWLSLVFGLTQHAGLAEDVTDHRLNCRTVYMNPLLRFLYWNMNYHVEHHMFPMVPYHALKALHAEIKADCPAPYPSLFAAYREILPALLRQKRDPSYFVPRTAPARTPVTEAA
ncbi:fatty acid desaturase family protein [Acidocella sp.]|uniref:fatty acid desaturase family protein n=1 Tax=Acidocella sp. TaxID=50710 RepID=UPI0017AAD1B4|nr:fatty acid desaturase family protein [Acidocella sp.]NNM57734.1 fatty acid desaturase family protein [Acidocella sp.]